MRRIGAFSLLTGFLTALAVGCGPSSTPAGTGQRSDPTPSPTAKNEILSADKGLAELEKAIAAKEKEVAGLRAEADKLRAKIAAANDDGADGTAQLLDLLATLPKEKWPTDQRDSLRMIQALNWYASNLAGRRARYNVRSPGFYSDEGSISVEILDPKYENLFGRSDWEVQLKSPTSNGVTVEGLSLEEAERVRSYKEPEVTFKIKSIEFGIGGVLIVRVEEVAFTGNGP